MKKYKEKEWLIENYLKKNRTLTDISKECGVSVGAVRKFVTKFKLKKRVKIYKDKDWLYDQYINKNKSCIDIAKQCNTAKPTILSYLHRYKIPIRNLSEATKIKFDKLYELPQNYEVYFRKGYLFVRLPEGRNKPYHVWIMEQEIGRKLKSHERVHHIDGNKLNNNLNNLFLCKNTSEHRKIHFEIERIAFLLIEKNILYFDIKEKNYKISKNLVEDTDNQQGQLRNEKPSETTNGNP